MKEKSLTVKGLPVDLLRAVKAAVAVSGKKTPEWVAEALRAKIPIELRPEPKKAKVAGK